MSNQSYSPEFKDEAVRQVIERGYSVPEVSDRLGVSDYYSKSNSKDYRNLLCINGIFIIWRISILPTEFSKCFCFNFFDPFLCNLKSLTRLHVIEFAVNF